MPTDHSLIAYATLQQGRDQVMEQDPTNQAEDPLLLESLRTATAMIDAAIADGWFAPRAQTRYFDAPTGVSDGSTSGRDLLLDVPLREVTSITNGDGAGLTSDDYTLLPREGAPYTRIRLDNDSTLSWTTSAAGDSVGVIEVAGVWAGSDIRFLAGAWLSTNDTVQTTISSTGTTSVVVGDSDGADLYGRTPRFSSGQLLRVTVNSSTEYLELVSISANTLAVVRGSRGTSALSSIPSGTAIEAWHPDRQIQYACARQAAFMLRSRGVYVKSEFDASGGLGTKHNTSVWDTKAWEIVQTFQAKPKAGRIVWAV